MATGQSAADRPVVYVTFANDQNEFLETLKAERDGIAAALQPYDDSAVIQYSLQTAASIDLIFQRLGEIPDRLAIFHYAGHASGESLHLDGGDAKGAGLADRFGLFKSSLKLVFLNGCATRGQVAALIARGVKAVIATAAPINDAMAKDFSVGFYNALADGMTLGDAFETATALVKTKGDSRAPQASRGFSWGGMPETPTEALPWGLYLGEGGEAVLDWTLPPLRDVGPELSPPTEVNAVNEALRNALSEGLSSANPGFAAAVQDLSNPWSPNPGAVQEAIVDKLPAPIAEQVRKLFNQEVEDEARLRQLLQTYDVTLRLFCFTALAQLWNEMDSNPGLRITEDQRDRLRKRLELTADDAKCYDDFGLIVTVMQIFQANGVQPFMPECVKLAAELTNDRPDDPVELAHAFMEDLRARLPASPAPPNVEPAPSLPPDQVKALCAEAYGRLGVVLADLGFVTRYFPVTVKRIEVRKARNEDAKYLYTEFALDRLTRGSTAARYLRTMISDSGCVLLRLGRIPPGTPLEKTYLNLTPFVIDQSSIYDDRVSSLYFLTSYDPDEKAYRYVSVVDPRVDLTARQVPEDISTPDSVRTLNELTVSLDAFKASLTV